MPSARTTTSGGDFVRIASPFLENTFRFLFGRKEFLMSYANSLLYPESKYDDSRMKIRDIRYVDGFRHLDIKCICTAYALADPEKSEVFELGLQRRVPGKFTQESFSFFADLSGPKAKVFTFLRSPLPGQNNVRILREIPNPDGSRSMLDWIIIQFDQRNAVKVSPGVYRINRALFTQPDTLAAIDMLEDFAKTHASEVSHAENVEKEKDELTKRAKRMSKRVRKIGRKGRGRRYFK